MVALQAVGGGSPSLSFLVYSGCQFVVLEVGVTLRMGGRGFKWCLYVC